ILNWLRTGDVDYGAKGEQKLNDMRERAAYIAKHTGKEPVSWYEFNKSAVKEKPHYLRNIVVGALIGGAILSGVGFVLGAALVGSEFAGLLALQLGLSGVLMGGAAGGFFDTENKRRQTLVSQYENYLDRFEATAGRAPAPVVA